MKEKLEKFWKWEGLDYLIQIAMTLVFVFGFMYASGANQTLDQEGCKAYWNSYHPEVNLSEKILVNATEKALLENPRRGRPGYTPKYLRENKTRTGNLSINLTS